MPRFSVLIPARNEEKYLPGCLDSICAAAEPFPDEVEVIVVLNRCTDRTEQIALVAGATVVHDDGKNLSRIRNTAARAATGEIVVTIDADSRMSPNMLSEVDRLLRTGRYVGGGVRILPERWSLGILASMLVIGAVIVWQRVGGGLFWCLRKDFEAIGGFDETLSSVEDLDFARRLKAHGKQTGRRFTTIRKARLVTSCRKFDVFGDWCMFRHPVLAWRLLRGRSQAEADVFFYDVER